MGVFSPTNIRIHVGDSVRFQNDGSTSMRIISDLTNGVLDLAGFDSVGEIPPKSVFTYTFSQTGIFGYHSARNLNEEGTVIVRP
ncbi:MAG: plastocyanin [Candidatus Yanofskybacteria bacterium]|nr:plastocyanin [Candidatus Yanofskybacteria bacterium]